MMLSYFISGSVGEFFFNSKAQLKNLVNTTPHNYTEFFRISDTRATHQ